MKTEKQADSVAHNFAQKIKRGIQNAAEQQNKNNQRDILLIAVGII